MQAVTNKNQVVTNLNNSSLNKDKIRQAVAASPTATVTMIALGMKERARSHSNLARIKSQLIKMNEKIQDKDYMAFWKALEEAGAGSLVLGRRGGKTRFEWNYSLRQIAQLAIEGKEEDIKRFEEKARISDPQMSLPLPQAPLPQAAAPEPKTFDTMTAKEVLHNRAQAIEILRAGVNEVHEAIEAYANPRARMAAKTIKLGDNRTAGVFLPEGVTSEEVLKIFGEFVDLMKNKLVL